MAIGFPETDAKSFFANISSFSQEASWPRSELLNTPAKVYVKIVSQVVIGGVCDSWQAMLIPGNQHS